MMLGHVLSCVCWNPCPGMYALCLLFRCGTYGVSSGWCHQGTNIKGLFEGVSCFQVAKEKWKCRNVPQMEEKQSSIQIQGFTYLPVQELEKHVFVLFCREITWWVQEKVSFMTLQGDTGSIFLQRMKKPRAGPKRGRNPGLPPRDKLTGDRLGERR